MKTVVKVLITVMVILTYSCNQSKQQQNIEEDNLQNNKELTAKDILGNPDYLAISYGGYREITRDIQPTIKELKEDMKILAAMGIKIVRTYNVQSHKGLHQAENLLKAIKELKEEDANFEMYVMLGAWIDCKNAWTEIEPDHNIESEYNEAEINRAVKFANQYPDIVKVIAVGNEAMIRWATSYYVQPNVILKWVNYLQDLKTKGQLSKDLWITCSDDFASWGGGDYSYRTEDLEKIIKAVDYVSMHTYPYHNSHYNPQFWKTPESEENLANLDKINSAMKRALEFAQNQYKNVSEYVKSIDSTKTVHIGETGWATISSGFYGPNGSRATDEYKEALYYKQIREWTNKNGISCFYFEAFNEKWKDAHNQNGSENHFGLITIDGKAKYALWDMVDSGVFKGLKRNGNPITKTFEGNKEEMLKTVLTPPSLNEPVHH